ncbi:DUF255 domain-containing protein [Cytophagales bacterium LB-30]|uniref:DUF255 domain-containing protein n=1 Tax=Shiella aurantiaca TaxID=3058365 RepID=A0ABT8F1B5_9BACT|nr:DUF255 domain-containing protein [Shiella aurantiaca]MDN4164242.1 DUF255 domain-containing protein [Shiella aurantiaca]
MYALIISFLLFTTPFIKEKPSGPTTIQWVSLEEAFILTRENPKKIFIDVYTDWCGWCKKMDKNTFSNPEIAQYINKHYYAVKLNAEQKEDIKLGDRIYKYVANGRSGYNEVAAALLQGKLSYPTIVFLDENFNMIQPLPGYQEPKSLEPIMVYFGENYYKNTSWDDFQKKFISNL